MSEGRRADLRPIDDTEWGPLSLDGVNWIVVQFSIHPDNYLSETTLADLNRLGVVFQEGYVDWHHSDRPLNNRIVGVRYASSYHLLAMLESFNYRIVMFTYFKKSDGALVVQCVFTDTVTGPHQITRPQYDWLQLVVFPRNHYICAVWDNPMTAVAGKENEFTARWLSINFSSGQISVGPSELTWALGIMDGKRLVAGTVREPEPIEATPPEAEAPIAIGVGDNDHDLHSGEICHNPVIDEIADA